MRTQVGGGLRFKFLYSHLVHVCILSHSFAFFVYIHYFSLFSCKLLGKLLHICILSLSVAFFLLSMYECYHLHMQDGITRGKKYLIAWNTLKGVWLLDIHYLIASLKFPNSLNFGTIDDLKIGTLDTLLKKKSWGDRNSEAAKMVGW